MQLTFRAPPASSADIIRSLETSLPEMIRQLVDAANDYSKSITVLKDGEPKFPHVLSLCQVSSPQQPLHP